MVNWFGFKNSDAQAGAAAFKGFTDLGELSDSPSNFDWRIYIGLGPLENESRMVPYEKLNTMLVSSVALSFHVK